MSNSSPRLLMKRAQSIFFANRSVSLPNGANNQAWSTPPPTFQVNLHQRQQQQQRLASTNSRHHTRQPYVKYSMSARESMKEKEEKEEVDQSFSSPVPTSSNPTTVNSSSTTTNPTTSSNTTTTPALNEPTKKNGIGNGNGSYKKKIKPSSTTRERFNNVRYFYADPEIDRATERPLVRLNPMTMLYMGVSDDNSHLLLSANYLRNELPIRLASMIKRFRNLPFIVASNPSMLEIHERCIKTFRMFEQFDKEIKDVATEKKFNDLVYEMIEVNRDILALLCDGFKETRRYIKDESFIKQSMNKILATRLGIRLLSEHHIALNKQSSLNKELFSLEVSEEMAEADDEDESTGRQDHFTSSYIEHKGTNGNNGAGVNHKSNKHSDLVGIVDQKFSPKRLIETSGRMVTKLCMDKYGASPKIKIDGHTNATFPYLSLPVEYILPELLKNSFRATYEHHYRNSASLPDIGITIAVNEQDFIIRIRDRGGGIPHETKNKIFDYHFTTADNEKEKEAQEAADQVEPKFDMNFGSNMICDASSSRGLAVMHGYGFGLPTSKAYAEYLGGSLSFQSMQGIGSDFYLRLGRLDNERQELVRI